MIEKSPRTDPVEAHLCGLGPANRSDSAGTSPDLNSSVSSVIVDPLCEETENPRPLRWPERVPHRPESARASVGGRLVQLPLGKHRGRSDDYDDSVQLGFHDECRSPHVALDKNESPTRTIDCNEGLEALSQADPIGYRNDVRVRSAILRTVSDSAGAARKLDPLWPPSVRETASILSLQSNSAPPHLERKAREKHRVRAISAKGAEDPPSSAILGGIRKVGLGDEVLAEKRFHIKPGINHRAKTRRFHFRSQEREHHFILCRWPELDHVLILGEVAGRVEGPNPMIEKLFTSPPIRWPKRARAG